jgi:hypothetical protein
VILGLTAGPPRLTAKKPRRSSLKVIVNCILQDVILQPAVSKYTVSLIFLHQLLASGSLLIAHSGLLCHKVSLKANIFSQYHDEVASTAAILKPWE